MVQITNKIYNDLFHIAGVKKDKTSNEHTLQCYIAIALLNDEIGVEKTTLPEIEMKIGKRMRRTQDIVSILIKKGLVKRHGKENYEVIG